MASDVSTIECPARLPLLIEKAYVAGTWVTSERRAVVVNPADDKAIGSVPQLGVRETRRAIDAASRAQKEWAAIPPVDRSAVLKRWHRALLEHQEELAVLMTLEQGKPIRQSRAEVRYGASYIEWFAEEARRINGDIIPHGSPDKRILVLKQPVGVTAAITPWNFPIATVTRKVAVERRLRLRLRRQIDLRTCRDESGLPLCRIPELGDRHGDAFEGASDDDLRIEREGGSEPRSGTVAGG